MYKVIKRFKDTDGKIYEIGSSYENEDKQRVEALLTHKNKCGYPFIEKVEVKKTRGKKVEVEVEAEAE